MCKYFKFFSVYTALVINVIDKRIGNKEMIVDIKQ